jgi:GDPmannose 4,6-dehydratase
MKKALITGITGQDGAYLAEFLLHKNYQIWGTTRYKRDHYFGLEYLGIRKHVTIMVVDLEDYDKVDLLLDTIKPDEVYNLAAQSSVGQSYKDPKETLTFNINSTIHILELIRLKYQNIKVYQASSSEMFGGSASMPITEASALKPLSPYAVSKAASHLMVTNYRETYGLYAVSGILFNHESFLRSPNFIIKKVIRECLEIRRGDREYLEVGNIDVKRDFGYSPKYVEAMWQMMQQEGVPEDIIICSGVSLSLRDIITYIFTSIGISLDRMFINKELFRPNEIVEIYGSNRKAMQKLNWHYEMSFFQVIDVLIEEENAYLK